MRSRHEKLSSSPRPDPAIIAFRRSLREHLLARRPESVFVDPFEGGEIGPDLFAAACRMGLEGLRSDRPYRGGRSTGSIIIRIMAAGRSETRLCEVLDHELRHAFRVDDDGPVQLLGPAAEQVDGHIGLTAHPPRRPPARS